MIILLSWKKHSFCKQHITIKTRFVNQYPWASSTQTRKVLSHCQNLLCNGLYLHRKIFYPWGSIRDSLSNWDAFFCFTPNIIKLIIFSPKDLKEEGATLLKIILFLSNQITQQTAPLINSTKHLSFKGIQQSISHKSSKELPLKVKLLNLAIHSQRIFAVGHLTRKW
jgi:hypothetical protein